jgi:hypothetical protein
MEQLVKPQLLTVVKRCNNFVDIIRLVARLFQQVRYSHDITILLQPCVVNLVTFLLHHRLATHAKISHLVTSLPTSRQQVAFALLVPSCQQVWNKLLTTCNNLVDIARLVARLLQQVRYSYDITILLQPCVVNLVTFLLYHDFLSDLLEQPCNKYDNANKLVTIC